MPQYQRTGRKMRKNHANSLPRYIIALDVETNRNGIDNSRRKFLHNWRAGSCISGRLVNTTIVGAKGHELSSPSSFWGILEKLTAANFTTWVIGHGILFDLIISEMPERMENAEYVVDWPRSKRKREDNSEDNPHVAGLAIIESPPTIIAVRCVATGGRIVFVDAMNWFPDTIRRIGEGLECEQYPKPDDDAPLSEWFAYCLRNCEIIFRCFHKLIKWNKDNNMGMFRYTAASQAMAAYRHRFMSHDILFHDSEDIRKLERKGYFGGRTEVFRIGRIREPVLQLDVNSLFPAVMENGNFPTLLDEFEVAQDWSTDIPPLDWPNCMAEVEIQTHLAIFPQRLPTMVFYPLGNFQTVLCGAELEVAAKLGLIRRIKSWAKYKTAPIFTAYVRELWEMRIEHKRQGNLIYAEFAKRLLNSLYGKFGQRSPKWVNVPHRLDALPFSSWADIDHVTGERTYYRSFGWEVQKQVEPSEMPNTFPAISAFVTAAARVRMNYLRWIAQRPNIYYQGVDGLIVTRAGLDLLEQAGEVSQTELGKLRIEMAVDEGVINGAADYRLGDKIVISGRARDIEQIDREEFYQRKFFSLERLFCGGPISSVIEELLPWQRVSAFAKGTIEADGWITPILLEGEATMDIKIKVAEGQDPNTGEVAEFLGQGNFVYVEDAADKKAGVATYRNQSDKGLDAGKIRAKLQELGAEVTELA